MRFRIYILIATILLFNSCVDESKGGYIDTKSMIDYQRGRVESLIFTYPNEDTISMANLKSFLRYERELEVKDFNFQITITSPENIEWQDSLSIELIDKKGEPVGNRNVMLYNRETSLIEGIKFRSLGSYIISIKPLDKELIGGIRDIGIQIERKKE